MPNLLIIGPTNSGKSMIVEKFKRMHPQSISSCGQHDIVPVVIMQMPSDPSPGRFYTALLRAINMPYLNYRVPVAIEQTVLRILGSLDTRMLIIDEIHNRLSGSNSKSDDPSGSARIILTCGRAAFNRRPTPVMVPPVPAPATKATIHLVQDFLPCRQLMHLDINRISKLIGKKPAIFLGQPMGYLLEIFGTRGRSIGRDNNVCSQSR
jgi:hypothetical protein